MSNGLYPNIAISRAERDAPNATHHTPLRLFLSRGCDGAAGGVRAESRKVWHHLNMPGAPDSARPPQFGYAWLALCLSFVAHVVDEATTGFLPVYNATVFEMRSRYAWFPMPTFEFRGWLAGLIVANLVLLLITPFAFRNAEWLRPIAYFFAGVMLLNGLGHTIFTIFGQTVAAVTFPRPAPGFYSSPFLLASSVWLLAALRSSRRSAHSSAT